MSTEPARPDLVTLLDWIEGRLPTDQADLVAQAVRVDSRTQERVGWLRRVRQTADWTSRNQPPAYVRTGLMASFDRWWQLRRTEAGDRSEVELDLVYDSRTDLTVAGSRGASRSGHVHLAYAGEDADVVVDLVPTRDGRFRLEGQLLAAGEAVDPVEAAVTHGLGGTRTTVADSLGRFTLPDVAGDVVELVVRSGRFRVRMSLDLRP